VNRRQRRRKAKGAGGGSGSGIEAVLAQARSLHTAGRLGEAEKLYRRILAIRPDHAEALHLLGILALQAGQAEAAIDLITKAVSVNGGEAGYHNNLGEAYRAAGRVEEALGHYRRAVDLAPGYGDGHFNLGLATLELGRTAEAIGHFERALALDPALTEAHFPLGNALREAGRLADAAAAYERALAADPDHAEAHANLGNVLKQQHRLEDAIGHQRRAVALQPDRAETHLNLAAALHLAEDLDAAIASYRRAIDLDPGLATAHSALAIAFEDQDRIDDAIAANARALELDPGLTLARWVGPFLLPVVYETPEEIPACRARFDAALAELDAKTTLADAEAVQEAFIGFATRTCFLLNYQGLDDRDRQRRYGALGCRIMAARFPQWAGPPPGGWRRRGPGERLRIGYVGTQFHNHTVGKLFGGWMTAANRDRFAIYCYHLGRKKDQVTREIWRASDEVFVPVDEHYTENSYTEDAEAFAALCERIVADDLDVLVYPDIGMARISVMLATLRLAPVQCATWGHPVTPGMPTIDYFLSSDLMEPPDGDAHYNERLVRLPNLSICYTRPRLKPPVKQRPDYGLRPDAVVYFTPQSLYKYLPQHDQVFPRIARRVPGCQFVFIEHPVPAVTGKFRRRLHRAFAEHGLEGADHCLILPRLTTEEFRDVNLLSDVYIDTLSWSGGKTTIEAVAYGLPVVTCPGALMRARHSYAILKRMGIDETIAADMDAYVDIACRLGLDPDYRQSIRDLVAARSDRVFDDVGAVRALERFYEQAVAEARAGDSDVS
jgi:predicted O-linked N-acetylglucosamine transferase (SPINDLY family)